MPTPVLNTVILDGETVVLGTTGRGKSRLIQAEADRLGITYDEMERRMQPSEEQLARQRQIDDANRKARAVRLNAMKEAYWANTPKDSSDRHQLRSAIVELGASENPTEAQAKALLMCLPADLFSQAIAWGITDTEVRDSLYTFISENRQLVVEAIRTVS